MAEEIKISNFPAICFFAMSEDNDKFSGKYLHYTGVGFEFIGAMGFCCLLGYLADRKWGSEPSGIIIGALVGIVAGSYLLIKESLKISQEQDEENKKRSDR